MSEPFIGEIQIMGFSFAPENYANCDGQLQQITQNAALFSLVGTSFGGDGRSTFGLPELRGRTPIGQGTLDGPHGTWSYPVGTSGGASDVTLSAANLPTHSHTVMASTDEGNRVANFPAPGGYQFATDNTGATFYAPGPGAVSLAPAATGNTGGGSPHYNIQPSLNLRFCIALQGLYPQRN